MDTNYPFSPSFEASVFRLLLTENSWSVRALPYLKTEKMPSLAAKLLLAATQTHHRTYNTIPTINDLEQSIEVLHVDGKIDDTKYKDTNLFLSNILKAENITIKYATDLIIKELRRQAFVEAIKDAGRLLADGKTDDLFKPFEEAKLIGQELRIGPAGLMLPDEVSACLDRGDLSLRGKPLPLITPELTQGVGSGGVYPGRLAAFLGLTGRGKTTALVDQACIAASMGINTIFFTLEMYEVEIAEKIISNITETPVEETIRSAWEIALRFRNLMTATKGRVIIKHLPAVVSSPADIKFCIQQVCLDHPTFNPGLVVVDYADLLSPTKQDYFQGGQRSHNAYFDQGDVFAELKSLASELHLVIWTAVQARRPPSGAEDKRDVLTEADVGESMRKVHILDLLISICMKDTERMVNQARLYIAKNRFGPAGQTPFGPYTTLFHINKFADANELCHDVA